MPDVTIVGGGPAGTVSARLLATSGRDVTLIEEHRTSGSPMHCAGVVSPEVINNFGVKPDLLGTISSADVIVPDGTTIHVSKRMPYAYVINREKLDTDLAERAEAAGVVVKYGVHCKSYQVTSDFVSVETNEGRIKSDLLVGADGQNSLIAASMGNNQVKSYIRGVQVDLKYRSDDPEKMILRLGNEVAPGFFSWQLPLGDITRIGLGVSAKYGSPSAYLERLLRNIGLDGCERIGTYAGRMPMGGRRTTYADRILLIGDAAGQVKPVSGGGLYPIAKVVPILKESVDRAYSMNIFNSSVLALYERSWKRELGSSFSKGNWLREYYDKLDDEHLNRFGQLFSREDIQEELSRMDIDDPGVVIKPILKKKGVKSQVFKTYLGTVL